MPIQLTAYERRDNTDRRAMGNKALEICRIVRTTEGIRSARFYWYGTETVVFLMEGETAALDAPGGERPEYGQAGFDLADMAKNILSWRLIEPRAGEDAYRAAGR